MRTFEGFWAARVVAASLWVLGPWGAARADLAADPSPPALGASTAEYNPTTGQLTLTVNGSYNIYVQSQAGLLVPLTATPDGLPGLLTNNHSRVGITNLNPIQLTNFAMGSIGQGLAMNDLELVYSPSLGSEQIHVPASTAENASFLYVPEPRNALTLLVAFMGLTTPCMAFIRNYIVS